MLKEENSASIADASGDFLMEAYNSELFMMVLKELKSP